MNKQRSVGGFAMSTVSLLGPLLRIVGDAGGFQVLRFSGELLKTKHGKAIHDAALEDDED